MARTAYVGMGIGWLTLICAALLQLDGLSADEAWARVEEARGTKVPDTEEQRRWVELLIESGGR